MLAAASRTSLVIARERLAALAAGVPGTAELDKVAEDLFAVVALLDRAGQLRRTLGDPTTATEAKVALLTSLLGSQIQAPAMQLVQGVVGQRWSTARDLVDALEVLSVQARFLAAEADGALDDVEDQLFRFSRIVVQEPALRAVLTDHGVALDRKVGLLTDLLDGKVRPATLSIIVSLVAAPRGRTLEDGLANYAELAAQIRQRSVAHVTSAVPLDQAEQDRLAAALGVAFGRAVQLLIEVDPALRGGVVVRVGDEVIDGSIATRLAQAQRAVAGS